MEMFGQSLEIETIKGFSSISRQGTPKIAIVDGQRIFREAVRFLLSARQDLSIIGEAKDISSFIAYSKKLEPDLVLMTSGPSENKKDAIEKIKGWFPATKILVLTTRRTDEDAIDFLQSGADGYFATDATCNELLIAIWKILAGEQYLPLTISERVMKAWAKGKRASKNKTAYECLTEREREILKRIAEGNTNKEIGCSLGISVSTVEKHRMNLMEKINAHNIQALTVFAINSGLVKIE